MWNCRWFCWNDEKVAWERHSNWRHDDTPRGLDSTEDQDTTTTQITIEASYAARAMQNADSTASRAIVCLENAARTRLSLVWLDGGAK